MSESKCPWCGKPVATEEVNRTLPMDDPGFEYCWDEYNGVECAHKPTFNQLLTRAQTAECRVAELETGGGLLGLWWFLNGNPDQPMPPGADPCKQAIEAIQALRAERDRLAEIVAAAEAARAKGGN